MAASNVYPVTLKDDGDVVLEGKFTEMDGLKVTLFHVWLWQSGGNGQQGVGLATAVDVNPSNHEFKYTTGPGDTTGGSPARVGRFGPGAATVSAFAVVSPTTGSSHPQEVLQWGRTLTLVKNKPA